MRTQALGKLTAKAVKNAVDGMHSDGGGLFLRVKGNSRAWVFRYTRERKKREMGMGSFRSVSLAEARGKSAEARALVSNGQDPISLRSVTPNKETVATPTFRQAMQRYFISNAPTWRSGKHKEQWCNSLENYCGPLMPVPVDQIDVNNIERIIAPIWVDKHETATRVRGRVERILGSCIARKEMYGPNPAAWRDNLEHILPKMMSVRKVRHHPAVPVSAAPAAFQALMAKANSGIGYRAVAFAALTGLRSGEARNLCWKDVGDDRIMIPAERMKAERDHIIPMSGYLASWMNDLEHWDDCELIFPGQSGSVMSDMTMAMAMRRSGLEAYTVHGWRSTFRDWAGMNGWDRELAEYQIAHQVGSAVERAYARDTLIDRRRPMMEKWEGYIAGPST